MTMQYEKHDKTLAQPASTSLPCLPSDASPTVHNESAILADEAGAAPMAGQEDANGLQAPTSGPLDADTQNKYRAAYLEQLRRRMCPGCGESEFFG
jgi:hypothetical protein